MTDFIETELSSFGKTVTGKTPSSKNPEDFGDKTPFVTPSDSFEHKYIWHTYRKLSDEGVKRLQGKLLPENSILVTCIGSAMGKVAMNPVECITNQQINSIVVNSEFFPDYIYYCLKNNYGLLRNAAGGSTALPLLNKTDFDVLKFRVHSNIIEQQKIAAVLSALDAKIELNNRINTELEAMAKTLYDYWFVQFDFPDENGKPYKSSGGKMVYNETLKREIPDGWEVFSIPDLLPIKTGKEDANFATENGAYPFFTCGEEILGCDSYAFDGKAILLAGNGNFGLKQYDGKFNAYQRTYVLIPNDTKHYSVVYLAVQDRIAGLTKGSRGSIIKFLTKGDIEDITLVLPPYSHDELFASLNTITEKVALNNKENQQLTQLRDWLLPMLMNGQVTVE